MNELAFDLCQHTGPRGGHCEAPIARGLLTGAWFHRPPMTTWPAPKAWGHTAEPSATPSLFRTA